VTSAAARAESALAGYRGSRQDRTLTKLRELGATIITQAYATGDIAATDITLGEGWRGTTSDLAALKRVPSLQQLHIYSESVNDEAVKHLAPLKQLVALELFGTGISDDAFNRLKKSLAGTTVDRRKGGLLGVRGDPTAQGGGCLVSHVQADSAAEKAGLQVGDVIKKFEGQPVDDFTSLTKLIATKGGGESVEIEVERQTQVGEKIEKQTLTRKATLDKWKNRPTLNVNYNENDLRIIIGR
jgi:membrane-associated protease RseP (regulator of RpoE activity)